MRDGWWHSVALSAHRKHTRRYRQMYQALSAQGKTTAGGLLAMDSETHNSRERGGGGGFVGGCFLCVCGRFFVCVFSVLCDAGCSLVRSGVYESGNSFVSTSSAGASARVPHANIVIIRPC